MKKNKKKNQFFSKLIDSRFLKVFLEIVKIKLVYQTLICIGLLILDWTLILKFQSYMLQIAFRTLFVMIIMFVSYKWMFFIIIVFPPILMREKNTSQIRSNLDKIFKKNFYKITFIDVKNKNNYQKYFNIEKIPSKREINFWLYRLKAERNKSIIVGPLVSLLSLAFYMLIKSLEFPIFEQFYEFIKIIKNTYPEIFELYKWVVILLVYTDQIKEINNDIAKVELLKDLDIKNE